MLIIREPDTEVAFVKIEELTDAADIHQTYERQNLTKEVFCLMGSDPGWRPWTALSPFHNS